MSDDAICGAYIFKNSELFFKYASEYIEYCEYSEPYMSGIYNVMCRAGKVIKKFDVDFHIEFGTPEEYIVAKKIENDAYFNTLM